MKGNSISTAKKWLKRAVALAVTAGVAAAFFGWPTDALCRIQPSATCTFLVVLLLTPLWGRVFCECLCPLGAVQSFANWLLHPKTHVRRVCTRLPSTPAQTRVRSAALAVFAVLLAAGYGAVAWMMTPYSIFGKALTLFAPGVALFAVVVAVAALGKGRTWCNWICPAGTLFTLLSRKPLCEHKVEGGCKNCRACFPKSAAQATTKAEARDAAAKAKPEAAGAAKSDAGTKPDAGAAPEVGVTRRATLKGVAILAAAEVAEKTTDGGFAEITLPGDPPRPATVLPPGAVSRAEFNAKCVACGLCITRCPGKCLRASTALKSFGQPEMTFRDGHCRLACDYKCARVCPAGALAPRTKHKKHLHMGFAVWDKSLCIRETEGVNCTACSRKCPVKAIHIVEGFPVVDRDKCIGCGACEHVCPARPIPAIHVEGYDRQKEFLPLTEDDLIAEMRSLLKSGAASCVVARDGVITARETGRGLAPLLKAYDEKRLAHAVVADKVIGRAAAAVCVAGGAKKVFALTMSADAASFLKSHDVECSAAKTVPAILDREMSASCPMEAAVKDLSDPAAMVEALKGKIGK